MVSIPEFIEEARTRHDERVGRRHERQDRRHARRVRFGELFDQSDLDDGEVILEDVEPSPEPAEEMSEPWDSGEKPTAQIRERITAYQDALARWRERHPEEPVGDPEEAPEEAEVSE